MLVFRLQEYSSAHCKATIQRWVSAVQQHNGSCTTRISVLGFPQWKQQKRPCCTSRHKCHKPTNANKTPQMARHFYRRLRLLCRLALWGLLTSSYFVVLQSPVLESSLTLQILHRFEAPPRSSTKHMAPSASILSCCCCCCSCSCLQPQLKRVGGVRTRGMST